MSTGGSNLIPDIDLSNVQGNILKGFNKPHARLVFFKFGSNKLSTIEWLGETAAGLDNKQEILIHISLSLSGIRYLGLKPPYSTGIYKGIGDKTDVLKLDPHEKDAVSIDVLSMMQKDDPFYQGMKERAETLRDLDKSNPANWDEPYKSVEMDILIMAASDHKDDLDSFVSGLIAKSTFRGIICTGLEIGETVLNEQGKQVEHFGFRDGVSQPLIKGVDEDARINERKNYKDILNPKDFVLFGLKDDLEWANDGSFLVFRKLEQDVSGFWKFMTDNCTKAGVGPEEMAARLIGRWKSGSPLAQSPKFDPVAPETSDRNDFQYLENTSGSLRGKADPDAQITPAFAHIRIANPRDAPGKNGHDNTPDANLEWNNQHRILRRGIPYGPYWASDKKDEKASRGLLFMCYQRDIEQQFEHIQRELYMGNQYQNSYKKKAKGKKKNYYAQKTAKILGVIGSGGPYNVGLETWVTAKGGGYFFSPSIYVLKHMREFMHIDEPGKLPRRDAIWAPPNQK
jgi:Dyp-type peroxidase family